MIQLYDKRRPQRIHAPPGVRRVLFSNHHDILNELNLSHRSQSFANIASPDPRHGGDALPLEHDNDSRTVHTEDPSHLMDEAIVSADLNPDRILTSEEHDAAACVIQKACRRSLKRRNAPLGQGLAARRSIYFAECLHHASAVQWTKRSYRIAYLGLLPHLLLCLNGTLEQAAEKKNEQKKRLATTNSLDDMDKIRAEQTAMKYAHFLHSIPGLCSEKGSKSVALF